jgi:hypothetical protein
MPDVAVISSCYFPSISWFGETLRFQQVILDLHEHYYKQTNRNRCTIITANGLMPLIIPVKTNGNHTPVKEVRIDYSYPWQRVHSHAIVSAYANAPYFEHYRNSIEKLYALQPEFLQDWNAECFHLIAHALKLNWQPVLSESYVPATDALVDLRSARISKSNVNNSSLKRYPQVFEERHGFTPDLSVLDVLFCCGPGAIKLLSPQ